MTTSPIRRSTSTPPAEPGAGGKDWVTTAATVGAAVNAGVFLAFSSFVMPAVRDLPAAGGIEAMQALDRAAPAPFTVLGFGTAILCLPVIVRGLRAWRTTTGRWMLGGAAAFLVSAIVITFAANVPISYTIDTLDPGSLGAQTRWVDLAGQWAWWNHLRTLGSGAAAVALAIALLTRRSASRR
jgi:uncharacterized membrane protein